MLKKLLILLIAGTMAFVLSAVGAFFLLPPLPEDAVKGPLSKAPQLLDLTYADLPDAVKEAFPRGIGSDGYDVWVSYYEQDRYKTINPYYFVSNYMAAPRIEVFQEADLSYMFNPDYAEEHYWLRLNDGHILKVSFGVNDPQDAVMKMMQAELSEGYEFVKGREP